MRAAKDRRYRLKLRQHARIRAISANSRGGHRHFRAPPRVLSARGIITNAPLPASSLFVRAARELCAVSLICEFVINWKLMLPGKFNPPPSSADFFNRSPFSPHFARFLIISRLKLLRLARKVVKKIFRKWALNF